MWQLKFDESGDLDEDGDDLRDIDERSFAQYKETAEENIESPSPLNKKANPNATMSKHNIVIPPFKSQKYAT